MKKILIFCICFILLLFFFMQKYGCDQLRKEQAIMEKCKQERDAKRAAKATIMDKAIQDCIDAGGIPILRSWDHSLENCIFPPDKKGS